MQGPDPVAANSMKNASLLQAAEGLTPATPELLEQRLLLRRFDRKYLMSTTDVVGLIHHLSTSHAVVLAEGARWAEYETAYFDTADRRAFHDHRRGRPRRAKVRVRTYSDRNLSVLEVKQRTGRGTTVKERRLRSDADDPLSDAERAWLEEYVSWGQPVRPVAANRFYRLSLLGLDQVERLTMDVDLQFMLDGVTRHIQNTSVVEVKTPTRGQPSAAVDWLHARGLRPSGFSKYCTASVMLDESLPDHAFRSALRTMNRLEAA